MAITAVTTKLEAVNSMLLTIGESAVATLSPAPIPEVTVAVQLLDANIKELCSRGWFWNTEYGVELTPNGDDEIVVTDICRISPHAQSGRVVDVNQSGQYVLRGTKVFDLLNKTYEFTGPITVTVARFLDWDYLPESARYYAFIKASRRFQQRVVGSDKVEQYTAEDEARALLALEQDNAWAAGHSIFDSLLSARVGRRPGPYGPAF